MLKAGWLRQTFLHWPFRPADVQVLLPPRLLVDEYDGMAWVSLTPFLMARMRPADAPMKPRVSTFPETNLRTYVRRPDRRDGIWFLSLEVGSARCWPPAAPWAPPTISATSASPSTAAR